jgi:hypothetical protein
MNLKDLLELAEKLEDRINAYWNFYTVVVLAAVGWLFSAEKNGYTFPSTVAAIALIGFFFANFSVIRYATNKLTALESEIEAVAPDAGLKSEKYIKQLRTWSIPNRMLFSWMLHLLVDAAVLAAIFIVGKG